MLELLMILSQHWQLVPKGGEVGVEGVGNPSAPLGISLQHNTSSCQSHISGYVTHLLSLVVNGPPCRHMGICKAWENMMSKVRWD